MSAALIARRLRASILTAAILLDVLLWSLPYESEINHLGPDTLEYIAQNLL